MRAAIQVLFLVFYLVSAYYTTQSRITYIVGELKHSTSRTGEVAIDDACKPKLNYTHFREAKNDGTEYTYSEQSIPSSFRLSSTRRFIPQTDSLRFEFALEVSAGRAPPFLS